MSEPPGEPPSAWAPFRNRLFAAMWAAQFVSNMGSWMQTVGAQWLMLTMTGSAAYVALVSTASSLPVMLFAVAAGAIGDLVDRRRFLLVAQGFMLAGLRFPFQPIPPADLLPAGDWPAPVLPADAAEPAGPVSVTVEYRPRPGSRDDLLAALRDARFSRRRTGATAWRLWQDPADPDRILEQFVVASWDEHLRQHERVTRRDADRFARIGAMTGPGHPPVVTHWITPSQQDSR